MGNEHRPDSTESYRDVSSPLTAEMLAPLSPESPGVAIDEPLTDDDFRTVAEFITDYPDKKVYVSQLETPEWSSRSFVERPITDLEFLRFFPSLQRFACNLFYLKSLDGLQHLKACTWLQIFKSPARLSAAPIGELAGLDYLMLDGQVRDLDTLKTLPNLTTLSLGYARKLPGLDFLPAGLRTFYMNRGSITDISALADTQVEKLSFFKVGALSDLSPVSQVTSLRHLHLYHLREVTNLPDMSALTDLTDLIIDDLKNLSDTRPVLTAPNLTNLSVTNLPSIDPQAWEQTWKTWIQQGRPPFWD
ncbi:leucine-rich repeat domain-containing protein [Mycolicibacterium neworleansense]|uniref:hypothetical protein n=1 Tax=Mycolicibacterium neworleansense TaxID=146018 RepID=UPI000B8334CB|nr:hypothetical protein [Mycolicibacterium neworleansense]MCV7363464.1 hypothetical protein [Mycolicibacterium neworleansense]